VIESIGTTILLRLVRLWAGKSSLNSVTMTILRKLIQTGSKVDHADINAITARFYAASFVRADIVRMFLRASSCSTATCQEERRTPTSGRTKKINLKHDILQLCTDILFLTSLICVKPFVWQQNQTPAGRRRRDQKPRIQTLRRTSNRQRRDSDSSAGSSMFSRPRTPIDTFQPMRARVASGSR